MDKFIWKDDQRFSEKVDCPICNSISNFFTTHKKTKGVFYKCTNCLYIFTPEKMLDFQSEKTYFNEKRINNPDGGSPEYHPYVLSLLNELDNRPLSVLDYGCGNGGLIRLLLNKGIRALGVDPIPSENNIQNYVYPTLADLPDKRFDIIVCIEVLEHLDNPLNTLSQLLELLDDNGVIFLTTALSNRSLSSLRAFPHWIYLDDPTHIGFFHEKTLHWIAKKLGVDVHIMGCNSSIILLDKTFNRLIFTVEGELRIYCDQEGTSKAKDDQSRSPIDGLLEKAKAVT